MYMIKRLMSEAVHGIKKNLNWELLEENSIPNGILNFQKKNFQMFLIL